ncbi:hypothetical protein NQ314_013414 [Rhamnusium bicolor]|uniref:Uncharacterized protein n=1 Tax=Rhamnusium bicolor TaxID=1586634 RepID=A0AAV8X7E6_9CUCU|nr:hypothetical protein NQ314_013414 [Rhamnusium bicolor]
MDKNVIKLDKYTANMLPVSYSVMFLLTIVQNCALNGENNLFETKLKYEGNLTDIVEKFKILWPVRDWKQSGYFTDEYISNINLHWLLFDPPEKSSFFILGVIYLIIMIFGFAGNFFSDIFVHKVGI